MSWPERICVEIVLTVWMEKAFLVAFQDSWQPRRIGQSEDAPIWVLSWRTDDGDRFWQHHLIARACVQISRGQETRLRGMRMYPSADKEVVAITEIEQFVVALFRSITGVTITCLVRDYQVTDEQSVRDDRSAKNAARLQVASRICMGVVQECRSQSWW